MTTKSPDICCISRCRNLAVCTLEGRGLCNEHFAQASDRKLAKFKEEQANKRTFMSFYEEGVYQSPNPKKYGWCE